MTRDEMIGEIINAWGMQSQEDDLIFLLNSSEAWDEMWVRQDAEETAHREAWLAGASVEWLPVVADIVDNPPDLSALQVRYTNEIAANWPYEQFDEECWLLQIAMMLSLWAGREPEAVKPVLERTEQKQARYRV